jgi:hypothetical protein
VDEGPRVVKHHYWTTCQQFDDDETSLSTTTPLITLSPALRRTDDTVLRVTMWATLGVTVGTASLPNLDWLAAATVDYLVWFDSASSGTQVNIADEVLDTMGFLRLNQTMWLTPTTNKYTVLFQGPAAGLTLRGRHKGNGLELPSISFQRWVGDNHGVFDNFAGFSVQFSSRMTARILWASDQAP